MAATVPSRPIQDSGAGLPCKTQIVLTVVLISASLMVTELSSWGGGGGGLCWPFGSEGSWKAPLVRFAPGGTLTFALLRLAPMRLRLDVFGIVNQLS